MPRQSTSCYQRFKSFARDDEGVALALVVAVAGIMFILLTALVTVSVQQGVEGSRRYQRAQVLDVADAGMSAYMRELQRSWFFYETTPTLTGTTSNGGSWTVTVTPPAPQDATIRLGVLATIPSLGVTRHIVAYVKPPSFADYAVIIDNPGASYSIGSDATFNGKVHANGSVDNAGVCNGTVSAVTAITGSGDFNGSPAKICPAPQIDFTTVTTDLQTIKDCAVANNAYFGDAGSYGTGQNYWGYKVDLNGTQYSVTKIKTLNYGSTKTPPTVSNEWVLDASTTVTKSIPDSGTIFFDTEPIFIAGTYSKPITIGVSSQNSAGSDNSPSGVSAVFTWSNLKPTDPTDTKQVCGIVTPGDISVPAWFPSSPTSYTVQAALLSQKGSIHGDDAYGSLRSRIDLIGSRAFKIQGGFSSAFSTRNYTYDDRFAVTVPPDFPRPVVYGGSALVVTSWNDSQ